MPLLEVFRLAIESIAGNKLRAGLTMLGMIIGVGAVILLVSIGNGAKNYITTQFEGIGTNMIMVQPGKTDTKMGFGPPIGSSRRRLTLGDVDALEKQSQNLQAVTGVVMGAGNLKTETRSSNTTIIGANEKFTQIVNLPILSGQYFTHDEEEFGRRVIVLGFNVAHNLFPGESALGRTVKVNESEHRVIGILSKSGDKLGFNLDEMVLVPTRSSLRIFNDDKLFGIRARAKSRVSLEDAVLELRSILRQRHNNQEDFTIITQDAMLGTMGTILNMLTYVLAGIGGISMLVGGIGIMNIMLVSVTERTREIGIRRAVGARRGDVLKQFLVEALVISLTGGLTGLAGAVAITHIVYAFTPSFDLRAPYWVGIPAFLLSTGIGIGFGVWPAQKAARIETIEALRFE